MDMRTLDQHEMMQQGKGLLISTSIKSMQHITQLLCVLGNTLMLHFLTLVNKLTNMN